MLFSNFHVYVINPALLTSSHHLTEMNTLDQHDDLKNELILFLILFFMYTILVFDLHLIRVYFF